MAGTGIPIMTVTVTLDRDPSLFGREHNRFSRAANYRAAEYHWEHHIPWHFKDFAAAKYSYWKRTDKYRARKRRIVGNKPDNVFSGKSEREVTKTYPKIRATPKGSTLIMKLPIDGGSGRLKTLEDAARLHALGLRKNKGFTQRQANSQIEILHRVAELEATAPDEVQKLVSVRADEYTRLANEPGVRKRIRFRTK